MIDTSLLPAFLAVSDTGNFSRAAQRVSLTQSTVSQQIRKLELSLGKSLFVRDTHRVVLTPAGIQLLPLARSILDSIAHAEHVLTDSQLQGSVRLGIADDFASSRLPAILRSFRRTHTKVDLKIEVALSGPLLDRLRDGALDLALVKTLPGDHRPEPLLTQEPLVWVGAADSLDLAKVRPLPLALHAEPSVTRRIVLPLLQKAGIQGIIMHESSQISGLRAGVLAGMGITAFGRNFIPPDLVVLDAQTYGLPDLPSLNFILARRSGPLDEAITALIKDIESRAPEWERRHA